MTPLLACMLLATVALKTRVTYGAFGAEEKRRAEFDAFVKEVAAKVPAGDSLGVIPLVPLANLRERIPNPLQSVEPVFFGADHSGRPPRFVLIRPRDMKATGLIDTHHEALRSKTGEWMLAESN